MFPAPGVYDALMMLLTLLALLAYLRRRPALAGLALGAAIAVKPTLGLYCLFFVRKKCAISPKLSLSCLRSSASPV